MTLEEQISLWYQAGEHENTIKAILQLPEGKLTRRLTEELAVAYNNLGDYEKAVHALEKEGDRTSHSCHWHYCMGYALYYMAIEASAPQKRRSLLYRAFDSFCEAITMSPETELETECLEFLEWIDEDLSDLRLPFSQWQQIAVENMDDLPPWLPEKSNSQFYDLDETPDGLEGGFISSVLLSAPWFDRQQFTQDFCHDWNLPIAENSPMTFTIEHMTASVSLMPVPIPGQEAETYASRNYLWPQAAEAARNHKSHLLITVWGKGCSSIDLGLLFVKITATCCRQTHVIGVCTNGVVLQPNFYRSLAVMTPEGRLPVLNWIWFGLYKTETGVSGYTYGLELFGKEEIEVLNSSAAPNQVRSFLVNVASYVLEKNATLHDGESIGFYENAAFPITYSRGIALPGMTFKIVYDVSSIPDFAKQSTL